MASDGRPLFSFPAARTELSMTERLSRPAIRAFFFDLDETLHDCHAGLWPFVERQFRSGAAPAARIPTSSAASPRAVR